MIKVQCSNAVQIEFGVADGDAAVLPVSGTPSAVNTG